MKGHGSKFELKKDEAVLALLTNRNVEDAAKAVGIDATTLMRWMKVPEFDAAYREAKRAAFSQTVARLHQMASAAASTLGKVMVDPASPASTRVRAAESILNHTMKAVELEDIEARIAELERAAESSDKK
jgi:hypothetical protein